MVDIEGVPKEKMVRNYVLCESFGRQTERIRIS